MNEVKERRVLSCVKGRRFGIWYFWVKIMSKLLEGLVVISDVSCS